MKQDTVLPMFPLGSVLFPHLGLPLRVFEPRYRQLVLDCLEHGNEFGVVLIERGNEVGGGDARFDIGTIARIVDAAPQPDGTWSVMSVGTGRVRVTRWLDDDPYPRAEVRRLIDEVPSDSEKEAITTVIERLRRTLRLCAVAKVPAVPADVLLSDDHATALWQACAIAPIGALDELTLLRSPTTTQRVTLLSALLDDQDLLLGPRIGGD